MCTALCVYRLACGPLNSKTPAVATDRLFCALPCVCTAFCVYRLACGPLKNKTPAVATDRFLCAQPCVCTAFYVYCRACGPSNNKTLAVATDRLLCAPPFVCTAFCVHRLVCSLNNKTPAVATDRLLCALPFVYCLLCVPPCVWPLKEQDSCGGYGPPFVCTALCVYRLACCPLNNKTLAMATDRLLCALPFVYRLLFLLPCVWLLKEQDSSRGYKPPFVCTALCVHRLVCSRLACGPLNNKTHAVATDRLLCAPPCVCTALPVAP